MNFNFPRAYHDFSDKEQKFLNYYKDCLLSIENDYKVLSAKIPNLKDIYLYNSKKLPRILNAWQVSNEDSFFKLCMVEFESLLENEGYQEFLYNPYLYGIIQTKQDFGHIIIRPKKFADKIIGIFIKEEIDFSNHKKFSKNFSVFAKDRARTMEILSKELLDFFTMYRKLEIEFFNDLCVFRLEKAIDMRETKTLCEIGISLNKIITNKNVKRLRENSINSKVLLT
jgi:hypothetical protein